MSTLASKTIHHVVTSNTLVSINVQSTSSTTPPAIVCGLYSPTTSLVIQSSYSVQACDPHMENCPETEKAPSHPGDITLYSSYPSTIAYCPSTTISSTPISAYLIPTSNTITSNASSTSSNKSQCGAIGCSPQLAIILGSALGGAALLAIAFACFLVSRRRRRKAVMAEEPMFETGAGEYLSLSSKPDPSSPLVPIVATDITNAEIEAELNDIATGIKELAITIPSAAPQGFDPEVSHVFVNTIQGAQGGKPPEIATGKLDAFHALQAAIAMLLTDRVLPQDEPYPQHPLMRSGDRREFDRWVRGQRGFEGMAKLTPERRRLWVAKYVKENLATSALLSAQRQEIIEKTTNEVISAIGRLYEGWDQEKLRNRIESLVEKALGLGCEIMGKDVSVTARWISPGEAFDERSMDMTDLEKVDGRVALCVFPMWVDSDGFLIARGKVYCV